MKPLHLTRAIAVPLIVALALGLSACGGGKHRPKTPTVGNRIPILSRIESGAHVDPTISEVSVILPPAEVNADWAQPGGSASKSYGHLALGENPNRIWNVHIAGSNNKQRLAAAPVVGGGKLFVMDTGGTVTAFNAATGARVWTHGFRVSGKESHTVYGGGATYDNDKVYVTTGVGEVAALNESDGSQLWSVKPAGPLRGSPTVAFGAIYVMTQNNQVLAIRPDDGGLMWAESGSLGQQGVFGVAAPAAGQGTVVAGYSTGELIAYRYENGRTLWSDALARTSISNQVGVLTDVDADPIIDRGRVYALGQGGRMAAYELVTGQRIWELSLAGISTPAIAGDWIFTLTDDGRLLCIARTSGKVRWIKQLQRYRNEKKRKDAYYWVGPVLAGNRLWLANSHGEVVAANVADGTTSLAARLGKPISLAPIVANQILYVLDDSGKITAFR
jgi:outer membrane protein assembly factor BamB